MNSVVIQDTNKFLDFEGRRLQEISTLKKKYNELEKSLCNIKESKAPKKTKKVLTVECNKEQVSSKISNLEEQLQQELSYCETFRAEGIKKAMEARDKAIAKANETLEASVAYFEQQYDLMIKRRKLDYQDKKNKLEIRKKGIELEENTLDCDKSVQEVSLEKEVKVVKQQLKSCITSLEVERKKLSNKVIAYLIETEQHRDYIKSNGLQSLYAEDEKEESEQEEVKNDIKVPTYIPKLLPITQDEEEKKERFMNDGEDFSGLPPDRIERMRQIAEEEYKKASDSVKPKKIPLDEDLCNINTSSFTQNDWNQIKAWNEKQMVNYRPEESKEAFMERIKRQKEVEANAKKIELEELLKKTQEPPPVIPKPLKKRKTIPKRENKIGAGISTYETPFTRSKNIDYEDDFD